MDRKWETWFLAHGTKHPFLHITIIIIIINIHIIIIIFLFQPDSTNLIANFLLKPSYGCMLFTLLASWETQTF